MPKLTKETAFKKTGTRAETLLDKTTQAAKEIIDDEISERAIKTDRLRKARMERDALTPADVTSDKGSKKPGAKTSKAKAKASSKSGTKAN